MQILHFVILMEVDQIFYLFMVCLQYIILFGPCICKRVLMCNKNMVVSISYFQYLGNLELSCAAFYSFSVSISLVKLKQV